MWFDELTQNTHVAALSCLQKFQHEPPKEAPFGFSFTYGFQVAVYSLIQVYNTGFWVNLLDLWETFLLSEQTNIHQKRLCSAFFETLLYLHISFSNHSRARTKANTHFPRFADLEWSLNPISWLLIWNWTKPQEEKWQVFLFM